MKNQLNLADVQPTRETVTYHWSMSLSEYNGKCLIQYSTNYPPGVQGEIWLVNTHGKVKAKNPVNSSGKDQTNETWGSGYYAIWVIDGVYTIAWTPPTK
ncbi:hypothetical protein SAMN04489761_0854 [Tenacibaculum sp. MAR_2009_124]|uniref:hypothetical protein n=1 Tax=Tenacibaculum sp. MAR_2009_124 TaxID=1250059 RepID=UPI0008993331|nr:hypothetical protein [Tenacibaculum sp. MAR_2009_124]SEB46133.1 hypothetical protein SAMN04489761_0854 [Tenacibaculum sp. MAR_2009_124]